jgi:hypothetical protein
MEKDLVAIRAGVAITKKKGELAAQAKHYARKQMMNATESLHCK